jgi:hypothetical protein
VCLGVPASRRGFSIGRTARKFFGTAAAPIADWNPALWDPVLAMGQRCSEKPGAYRGPLYCTRPLGGVRQACLSSLVIAWPPDLALKLASAHYAVRPLEGQYAPSALRTARPILRPVCCCDSAIRGHDIMVHCSGQRQCLRRRRGHLDFLTLLATGLGSIELPR